MILQVILRSIKLSDKKFIYNQVNVNVFSCSINSIPGESTIFFILLIFKSSILSR